jgi:hypothetical protein
VAEQATHRQAILKGGSMNVHPGVWIYVWNDPPTDNALDGYDGALVRAANGIGTTGGGVDFAANWQRWSAKFPGRVSPWTYLYPSSDGAAAARTLFRVTGVQAAYQVDLEDAVPPATIRAFCSTLRSFAPSAVLIFDSYPTRKQFVGVTGAPDTWDQAVKSFDAFTPQVYFKSQSDDGWESSFGDKPVMPAFSPDSWADWVYFQSQLETYGSVKLWRFPMTSGYRGKLTFKQPDKPEGDWFDMATQADLEKVLDKSFSKRYDEQPAVTMREMLMGWHTLASAVRSLTDSLEELKALLTQK